MSSPKSLALPALAGGASGAAAASLVLWRLLRKRDLPEPDPGASVDEFIAFDIMETARAFAAEVGRPEVATIVARKLLLARRVSASIRRPKAAK